MIAQTRLEERAMLQCRIPFFAWATALLVPLTLFAQADRGMITGIVADQQGGAIPNATVQIKNQETQVLTTTSSNSSGNFTSPALIIGLYDVRVEVPGFKAYTGTGIRLDSGQTYRLDISMEVGDVTQRLEVTASTETVNQTNAEVSASVDTKYYQDLPAVISTDIRLPENMLYTIPGFVSLKPTNTFPAGTQFHSRLNGGQRTAFENYMDGASYGEVSGHNQTQERSVPFESVAELRVIENTFSAQYGHTSGGFVEYTTKSGTARYHGEGYEYFQNSALNARGEAGTPLALHQNSFGFTLGGPLWIPKVPNSKQRMFFFFNLDQMIMYQGASTSYITIPTGNMRQGNFGQLLTSNVVGTDACGRQLMAGQIFDPATTRDASTCGGPKGVSVRDPFPNNIVPIRSTVGGNVNKLLLDPTRPGIANNYIQFARDQYLKPRTYFGRIDYNVTDNVRLTNSINFNDRPRLTDCGGVGGCYKTSPLETGDVQDIATVTDHFQITYTPKPNLFTHIVLGYDRWVIPSTGDYQNQGWASKLGIKGLPNGDAGGFPGINFDARYYNFGRPAGVSNQATDRYQILDDTTWIVGSHTLKAGFEFRRERWANISQGNIAGVWSFSYKNTAAFDKNGLPIANTGDAYASMLLGQVGTATFDILANPDFRRNYWAPWINDDFKVTRRLTLSFGFRWDLQGPRTETRNRYSRFNGAIANPAAGGRLGALDFAGVNGAPRNFEKLDLSALGPRFGFAYQPKDRWSIRGGYGIYYAPVVMNQNGSPVLGFSSSPLVTDVTSGQQPAFLWDNGFPQGSIRYPPFVDPSFGNGQNAIYVKNDTLRLPRYQNWTFSVQKQLREDLLIEAAYIGNRGTRLISGSFLSALNQNNPAILSQYQLSLLTSSITSPQAVAAGISLPYPGFTGTVAQALRPYPQYQNITAQNGANGESWYEALQIKLEKRFSAGLQFRIAYVFSRLENNGAESGQSESDTPPQSVYLQRKALSVDNQPHQLLIVYTYQLPFGNGKRFLNMKGPLDYIAGGWNVSGVQRYNSGRPLGVFMNNSYSSVLFDTALAPDRVAGVIGYLNNNNSNFDITKDRYLSPTGWNIPPAGRLGNASRVDPVVRGWAAYNEDISLFKSFRIAEPLTMRFGANLSNIFNRHEWCDPNTNLSDPAFGTLSGQCNIPRRIEMYAKFTF
jgi:hypothetical protein